VSEAATTGYRRWLQKLQPLAMPAAYALFLTFVWWRLWTGIDGAEASWKYDPRYTYWGDLVYQFDSLRDGHLALWNPWDRAGYPVYADPHSGFIYPPNWPLWFLALFTGGVSYAFITIKIFAHWVFGCVGMHLFLRRQGAREQACYVGGLLFGFTCPAIRYGGNALNWGYAWIPWVLLAVWWFAQKPNARRGIILGSAAAMVLLSGGPAVVIYTLLIAVPYGIYALRGQLRASIKPIAIAGGVAVLWMLPLVLSNLSVVGETVRKARSLSFVGDSVFTTAHVVSFIVPKLGEGENIYYGVLPLLCAGALIASAGRTRALIFCGVAVVGTLLAMGHHAGVLPSFVSVAPPLGWFRRAHRYLYVVSVAVAVLGGIGLAHLLSIEDEERKKTLARRVLWVGGLTTFALAIAYLVSIVISKKIYTVKNVGFGHAVVAAGVGTALLRAALVNRGRTQTVYAWIIVAVVAVDLWTANSKVIDIGFSRQTKLDKDHVVKRLEGDLSREWRIYDKDYLSLRPGTRLHIRDMGGYEDDPLGLARWRMVLDAGKRNARIMGHANVRYWLAGRGKPVPRGPGVKTLFPKVWEIPAAPAVLYVPNPVSAPNPRAALGALAKIAPGQGAVLEGPTPPRGPAGVRPTAGRITVLEPNRVVAEIDAPGPGVVVVAEAYFSQWKATLNGKSTEIYPANVGFRGVHIPGAGHYRIEMTLRPLRFWGLFPAYLAALGLFLWALIYPVWRRRRERSPRGTSTPPSSDPPTEEGSA
jgi:hypothetical protein